MNVGNRQRVQDLFAAALDDQPADLDRWLEQAGEIDPAVRAEVRSLLEHAERAGAFLSEPLSGAAEALLTELTALAPGDRIGPYVIQRELGRGGMGQVYLATDSRLGRLIALKAVRPQLAADSRSRGRLRREARAAAALSDPGICAVYALEEIDGRLFIASEFIDGQTLREEIERGSVPTPVDALRVARDLARSLASAHARGIVHRDLKPANIIRAHDGHVKVLDFGLARIEGDEPAGAESRLSIAGTLVGTPAYMAPEQLTGGSIDTRTDVFAFGLVMYEYLTGTHPFAAPTPVAMAGRILEAALVPLPSIRPDTPLALATVVHRCLQKSPGDRYTNGASILEALDGDEHEPPRPSRHWWHVHQVSLLALYAAGTIGAWRLDDVGGTAAGRTAFLLAFMVAVVGGVIRGHLLFTERVHPMQIGREWTRTRRVLLATDLVFGVSLFGAGVAVAPVHGVLAALAMALAAGVGAAALLIEPATATATLPNDR